MSSSIDRTPKDAIIRVNAVVVTTSIVNRPVMANTTVVGVLARVLS